MTPRLALLTKNFVHSRNEAVQIYHAAERDALRHLRALCWSLADRAQRHALALPEPAARGLKRVSRNLQLPRPLLRRQWHLCCVSRPSRT